MCFPHETKRAAHSAEVVASRRPRRDAEHVRVDATLHACRGTFDDDPASQGRVQARSWTWPALYTPPGHAVSRAVEQFAEQHLSGRFSSI